MKRETFRKWAIVLILGTISIFFSAIVRNSFATSLVVDQNAWEYASYQFDFTPITSDYLTFDFNFTTALDASDPSDPSSFPDSFYCEIATQDGNAYALLSADSVLPSDWWGDPYGSAPGLVAVTTSSTAGYSYTLTADISAFKGLSGNIYFELADWGDGYDTTVEFENIQGITPVPEPSTIFLLGLSLLGIIGLINKRD